MRGPAAHASTERTADVAHSAMAYRPIAVRVKSPAVKRGAAKSHLKKPLLLSLPRLALESSMLRAGFGALMPNLNQAIQRGGRDFREAPEIATDLSMFRLHLNPEWRLQWDFNRRALPAERQTLGLNIGLYHEF